MAEFKSSGIFNATSELLGNHASIRGEKVAIFYQDSSVTYKELEQNVNRFANVLKDLGINPKDRVMIVAPDSPEFVYAFLGSIKYGANPVPVNTMLTREDYNYLLADSGARLLVTSTDSEASLADTSDACQRLYVDNDFVSLMNSASTIYDPYPAKQDDIAFWLYSFQGAPVNRREHPTSISL